MSLEKRRSEKLGSGPRRKRKAGKHRTPPAKHHRPVPARRKRPISPSATVPPGKHAHNMQERKYRGSGLSMCGLDTHLWMRVADFLTFRDYLVLRPVHSFFRDLSRQFHGLELYSDRSWINRDVLLELSQRWCPKLHALSLNSCAVAPRDMRAISSLPLQWLSLAYVKNTWTDGRHFSGVLARSLKHLDLSHTCLYDADMKCLTPLRLISLRMARCKHLTGSGFMFVDGSLLEVCFLTWLCFACQPTATVCCWCCWQELDVFGCKLLHHEIFSHLDGAPRLRVLNVGHCFGLHRYCLRFCFPRCLFSSLC